MSATLEVRLDEPEPDKSKVQIFSFGFEYGVPDVPLAVVLDLRDVLHNPPDRDSSLLNMTGLDRPVREHVFATPGALHFISSTAQWIWTLVNGRPSAGFLTSPVVLIGCRYGQHRSVVVAEAVAAHLTFQGIECTVKHRDISKRLAAA